MAGKKGMFEGRRQSPVYVDAVRSRIRAGGIVNRLEKHVLGQIEMSTSQVTAALGLLRKVVPDIASVEHTGAAGGPLEIQVVSYQDSTQLHATVLPAYDTPGAGLRH